MASFRVTHVLCRNIKYLPFLPCLEVNASAGCLQRIACYSMVSSSIPGVEIPDLSHQINRRRSKVIAFKKKRIKPPMAPPRHLKMKEDQDWTSVWPTAMTFRPSTVPLPIRMGVPVKRGAPPSKIGNTELMKIPNFLHLTPPAIKKHCAALKVFCTEWPKALDVNEKIEQHFPLEIETSDYIFSGPSLRHPLARIVKLRVKLRNMSLDLHARRKLIKLVGDRYNVETDTLTLIADRCPTRKQNRDYALYLLTVLYHESWKTESWEAYKTPEDMEEYIWDDSISQKNMMKLLQSMKEKPENLKFIETEDEIIKTAEIQQYKDAMKKLHDEKESVENMEDYKAAVKKLVLAKSS